MTQLPGPGARWTPAPDAGPTPGPTPAGAAEAAPWDDLVAAETSETAGAAPAAGAPTTARGRGRAAAVVSALLLLVLFAGDLVVALGLPVRTSTCDDRLCGPALPAAAGAAGLALVALVLWLAGDARRDRGRGTGLLWVAVLVAALPWALAVPAVRWW